MLDVDTPVPRPTSRLDAVKSFLGDLARPFSIISISGGTAASIIIVSMKGVDYSGAAFLVAAELAGLAGLYWGKAWENAKTGSQVAEVEKKKVEHGQSSSDRQTPGSAGVAGTAGTETAEVDAAPR